MFGEHEDEGCRQLADGIFPRVSVSSFEEPWMTNGGTWEIGKGVCRGSRTPFSRCPAPLDRDRSDWICCVYVHSCVFSSLLGKGKMPGVDGGEGGGRSAPVGGSAAKMAVCPRVCVMARPEVGRCSSRGDLVLTRGSRKLRASRCLCCVCTPRCCAVFSGLPEERQEHLLR